MPEIPDFLLGALHFREPRRERLRYVTDSEWEAVLSNWHTGRLVLPLRQEYGDDLPNWVCSRIDTHQSDIAFRFERIKNSYATVAKALKDVDADHVVIKGFSLWTGDTQHPRLRPQGDIDLYCPPESISRAGEALIELGYTPNRHHEHLGQDHLCIMVPKSGWRPCANIFDPEMQICIELHFCLWNEPVMRFCPKGLDQFWARRVTRRLDELLFASLEPVDNLGYTALNTFRDLLRGGTPTAAQVYTLAHFLHTQASDRHFWQRWRELHDDSLRRLETISFRLASDWFGCRLSEEVEEELDRSPAAVNGWFREFSKSGLSPRFDKAKDGLWLHLAFLDSFKNKTYILLTGLLSVPMAFPSLASVLGDDLENAQAQSKNLPSITLRWCLQLIVYLRWSVFRTVVRIAKLPFFLWRGLRFWMSTMSLGKQFWTFLAASFCLELGMMIYFFLYNLYLLDRGCKEEFLGAIASAMNIGTIASTIPAGILIERVGLRKSLLLCFALVPAVLAARAVFAPKSALLALAFLGGFVATIWAVAISPAITRLTTEKSRPLGFSIVFSSGIGIGILANLAASRMPGWITHVRPILSSIQTKQIVMLVSCVIVALGLLPISRLRFPCTPLASRKLFPRSGFLLRFLPAMALWSLVTGSLSPLANVYFSHYLRMPLEQIGIVFSFSSLAQVLSVLLAPFLFRKLGLITTIASTQLATAAILACLAATSASVPAAMIYVGYTGLLWMSEPGLFSLLMNRVALGELAGASALNFLVISLSQAVGVAAAGASFTRFGYPTVLGSMAAVALTAAVLFRLLLGKDVSQGQVSVKPH